MVVQRFGQNDLLLHLQKLARGGPICRDGRLLVQSLQRTDLHVLQLASA